MKNDFLSANTQALAKLAAAKAALFNLYDVYGHTGQFSMGAYDGVQRSLDEITALLMGTKNTKTYPYPCSEILLTTCRRDD